MTERARISEAGVYDLPLAAYIEDPCSEPSLSASIGWTLLTRTPLHAWAAHPRLNPEPERRQSKEMDFGTVAHRLLLGKGAEIEVIDADSYRTKAAQETRDAAYERGNVPILTPHYERAEAMAEAARRQLEGHDIRNPFDNPMGRAEQTLIWREANGIMCRVCVDWLLNGAPRVMLYDIKTTTNAHPNAWVNRVVQLGHAYKAAWYCRAAQQVLGTSKITFRFITQETTPPFALAVYEIDDEDMIQAEEDIGSAISWWGRCLETGVWPGYPPKVMKLPLPGHYRMAREKAQESGELSDAAIEQAIAWSKGMLEGA